MGEPTSVLSECEAGAAYQQAFSVALGTKLLTLDVSAALSTGEVKRLGAELVAIAEHVSGDHGTARPKVYMRPHGERIEYGFYVWPWALGLLEASKALPHVHREALRGLLFGYAPSTITRFVAIHQHAAVPTGWAPAEEASAAGLRP